MIGIKPLGTQHRGEVAALLTVVTQEEAFGLEIVEANRLLAAKAMRAVEDHVEGLVEQFPTVETVPGFADGGPHGKLCIAGFQILDDLGAGATKNLQLNFTEGFSQFVDVRQDEAELDAAGYRKLECADLAIIDHGGERTRALGAIVALLEKRKHSLAKRREHCVRPLAPEKIAAQFAFQKLNGTRQRRLGHVALLCRAREVQRPRDGQEISNLVHFHANVPLDDHRTFNFS